MEINKNREMSLRLLGESLLVEGKQTNKGVKYKLVTPHKIKKNIKLKV